MVQTKHLGRNVIQVTLTMEARVIRVPLTADPHAQKDFHAQ